MTTLHRFRTAMFAREWVLRRKVLRRSVMAVSIFIILLETFYFGRVEISGRSTVEHRNNFEDNTWPFTYTTYPDVDNTLFIFSVIAVSGQFVANRWDQIAITGWETSDFVNGSYTCCYLYNNGSGFRVISNKRMKEKRHLFFGNDEELISVQVVCDLRSEWNDSLFASLDGVGLSISNSCDSHVTFHRLVYVEYRNNTNVAICGKMVYGKKDPRQLVEWIEFHKYYEAGHLLIYAYYDVNPAALRVLRHYERAGKLQVIYMSPVTSIDEIPRHFSGDHNIMYHDEHVFCLDAQVRLSGYRYFILMDTDEFLCPQHPGVQTYPQLMEILLTRIPKAASFMLFIEVFVTTWGETHPGEDLSITRYQNRTPPLEDRVKHLHVTSRIQPGSAWIHTVDSLDGFTLEDALVQEVVLKHYRSCRTEWLVPDKYTGLTECNTFERIQDNIMVEIADKIRHKVLRTFKLLGLV